MNSASLRNRAAAWLGGAAVFACTIGLSLFAFRGTLNAPFASDDLAIWGEISRGTPFNLFTFGSLGATFFRPVVPAVLYLVYSQIGTEPWVFHALQAVLHGLTAGLLFFCAREASQLLGFRSNRAPWMVAGAIGSLLFLFLRTHAEPVNWLSSVGDTLAATFSAAAFFFYLRFRNVGAVPSLRGCRRLRRTHRLWKGAVGFLRGTLGSRKWVARALGLFAVVVLASAAPRFGFSNLVVPVVLPILVVALGGASWSPLGWSLLFAALSLLSKEAGIGLLAVVFAIEWVRMPLFSVPVGAAAFVVGVLQTVFRGGASFWIIGLALIGLCAWLVVSQNPDRRAALNASSAAWLSLAGLVLAWLSHGALAIVRAATAAVSGVWEFANHPRKNWRGFSKPIRSGFGAVASHWRDSLQSDAQFGSLWSRLSPRLDNIVGETMFNWGGMLVFGCTFLAYWRLRASMLNLKDGGGAYDQYHANFGLGQLKVSLPTHLNNATFGMPTEWPFGWILAGFVVVVFALALVVRWRTKSPAPAAAILALPVTLAALLPAMPLQAFLCGMNERFAYLPSFFAALGIGFVVAYLLPSILALAAGVALAWSQWTVLEKQNLRWKVAADQVQTAYDEIGRQGLDRVRKLFVMNTTDFMPGETSLDGAPQLFKTSFGPGIRFHFPESETQVGVASLNQFRRPADGVEVRRLGPRRFLIELRSTVQGAEGHHLILSPESNGMFRVIEGGRQRMVVEPIDFDPEKDAVITIDLGRVVRL